VKLKQKRENTQLKPKSFLNLLIGPDLGMVGEGSARRVQRGTEATPGLDIGRSDMGDPSVFGR